MYMYMAIYVSIRNRFEYRLGGYGILLISNILPTFKSYNFDLGCISFILPMHESSSGLIASEISNSWKEKLVL